MHYSFNPFHLEVTCTNAATFTLLQMYVKIPTGGADGVKIEASLSDVNTLSICRIIILHVGECAVQTQNFTAYLIIFAMKRTLLF